MPVGMTGFRTCKFDSIEKGMPVSKMPVNKAEIIDVISESANISKAAAGKALNAMIDAITQSLQSGKSVSLLGFGTFVVKPRAARTGRNPKTGEPIQINAANIPTFKAGKGLKDAVNSGSIVAESDRE